MSQNEDYLNELLNSMNSSPSTDEPNSDKNEYSFELDQVTSDDSLISDLLMGDSLLDDDNNVEDQVEEFIEASVALEDLSEESTGLEDLSEESAEREELSQEVSDEESMMEEFNIEDNSTEVDVLEEPIAIDNDLFEEELSATDNLLDTDDIIEDTISLEDEVTNLLDGFEADHEMERNSSDSGSSAFTMDDKFIQDSFNIKEDNPIVDDVYGFNIKDLENIDINENDKATDDFFDNFINDELGMSEDEIENLLSKATTMPGEEEHSLDDIVKNHNDDLDAINELLRKVDEKETVDVDIMALLSGDDNDDVDRMNKDNFYSENSEQLEEASDELGKGKKKKKVKKEKIAKKRRGKKQQQDSEIENSQNEGDFDVDSADLNEVDLDVQENLTAIVNKKEKKKKEKKPSIWTKFVEFLMADDEENSNDVSDIVEKNEASEFDQLASNSDENTEVLKQLDEEAPAKGKKKKEKKPPKEKKEKKVKSKDQKEKKEKKEKEAVEPIFGPHLPVKRVVRLSIIFAMITVLFIIVCIFYSDYKIVQDANTAYYQNNYTEAYHLLYGKELSSSDELIFKKATVLSKMERRYDSYEAFVLMQKEVEALHSLLMSTVVYDEVYVTAEELNITKELDDLYSIVTNELLSKYALTEEEAKELLQIQSNEEYTDRVYEILEEVTGIVVEEVIEQELENLLEQEEELDNFNFIS